MAGTVPDIKLIVDVDINNSKTLVKDSIKKVLESDGKPNKINIAINQDSLKKAGDDLKKLKDEIEKIGDTKINISAPDGFLKIFNDGIVDVKTAIKDVTGQIGELSKAFTSVDAKGKTTSIATTFKNVETNTETTSRRILELSENIKTVSDTLQKLPENFANTTNQIQLTDEVVNTLLKHVGELKDATQKGNAEAESSLSGQNKELDEIKAKYESLIKIVQAFQKTKNPSAALQDIMIASGEYANYDLKRVPSLMDAIKKGGEEAQDAYERLIGYIEGSAEAIPELAAKMPDVAEKINKTSNETANLNKETVDLKNNLDINKQAIDAQTEALERNSEAKEKNANVSGTITKKQADKAEKAANNYRARAQEKNEYLSGKRKEISELRASGTSRNLKKADNIEANLKDTIKDRDRYNRLARQSEKIVEEYNQQQAKQNELINEAAEAESKHAEEVKKTADEQKNLSVSVDDTNKQTNETIEENKKVSESIKEIVEAKQETISETENEIQATEELTKEQKAQAEELDKFLQTVEKNQQTMDKRGSLRDSLKVSRVKEDLEREDQKSKEQLEIEKAASEQVIRNRETELKTLEQILAKETDLAKIEKEIADLPGDGIEDAKTKSQLIADAQAEAVKKYLGSGAEDYFDAKELLANPTASLEMKKKAVDQAVKSLQQSFNEYGVDISNTVEEIANAEETVEHKTTTTEQSVNSLADAHEKAIARVAEATERVKENEEYLENLKHMDSAVVGENEIHEAEKGLVSAKGALKDAQSEATSLKIQMEDVARVTKEAAEAAKEEAEIQKPLIANEQERLSASQEVLKTEEKISEVKAEEVQKASTGITYRDRDYKSAEAEKTRLDLFTKLVQKQYESSELTTAQLKESDAFYNLMSQAEQLSVKQINTIKGLLVSLDKAIDEGDEATVKKIEASIERLRKEKGLLDASLNKDTHEYKDKYGNTKESVGLDESPRKQRLYYSYYSENLKTLLQEKGLLTEEMERVLSMSQKELLAEANAMKQDAQATQEATEAKKEKVASDLEMARASKQVQDSILSIEKTQSELFDQGLVGTKTYEDLESQKKQLQGALESLSANKDINAFRLQFVQLSEAIAVSKNEADYLIETFKQIPKDALSKTQLIGQAENQDISIDKYLSQLNTLKSIGEGDFSRIRTELESLKTSLAALIREFNETGDLNKFRTGLANIANESRKYKAEIDALGKAEQEAKKRRNEIAQADNTRRNLITQISEALRLNSGAQNSSNESSREAYSVLSELAPRVEKLYQDLAAGTINYEEFTDGARQAKNELAESLIVFKQNGDNVKSLSQRLQEGAKKFTSWLGISQSIMYLIRSFRQLLTTTIEIDTALNQLQIVTRSSQGEMEKYASSMEKTAQEIGTSITDLIDATTVYARLGYTLSESKDLAKYTTMLQAVGDIEAEDAQNALTAIIKAFDQDASDIESVMDKLVTVGNNFPISVSQIAEGMNNASSALSAAGNSFEESVALLTAANTTVQNASKSSTGLRTIAARIRNTKAELDDLGEEVITEAKYEEIVGILTKQNVALREANGEYRSTYDILKDIAKVWGQLRSDEQAALVTNLAGTRQQDVFYSIINNFKEAEEAVNSMVDSTGELEAAYSIRMDSIQARIDRFKAAFATLGTDIYNSDMLKGIIDFGTGLITILDNVLVKTGALLPVVGTLSGLLVASKWKSISQSISSLLQPIKSVVGAMKTYVTAFAEARAANMSFGESTQWAGLEVQSLSKIFSSGAGYVGILVAALAAVPLYISHVKKANEELSSSVSEAIGEYDSTMKENVNWFSNIDDLSSKYQELSKGVDNLGRNVSLTTSEYEEYKSVVSQIASQFPDMITGYNDEGTAILNTKGSVEELVETYKKLIRLQNQTFIGEHGKDTFKDFKNKSKNLEDGANMYDDWLLTSDSVNILKDLLTSSDIKKDVEAYYEEIYRGDLSRSKGADWSAIYDAFKKYHVPERKTGETTGDYFERVIKNNHELIESIVNDFEETASEASIGIRKLSKIYLEEALNNADIDADLQPFIQTINSSLKYDFFQQFDTVEELYDYYDAFVEQIKNLNDDDKTTLKLGFTAEAEFDNGEITVDEYISRVEGVKSLLSNLFGDDSATEVVDLLFNYNRADLEKSFSEIREKVEESVNLGKSIDAFDNAQTTLKRYGATATEVLKKVSDKSSHYGTLARRYIKDYNNYYSAISKSLQSNLASTLASEEFAETRAELAKLSATEKGISADNIKKLVSEDEKLAEAFHSAGVSARFFALVLQRELSTGDGLELLTADALKLDQALMGLETRYGEVSEAQQRYNDSMSLPEYDDDFKSYSEAFEALNKQFEAGTVGSREFWNAAEFLFGTEQLSAMNWDVDSIYSQMQNVVGIFEDADSAGYGFLDRLYAISDAEGNLYDESGNWLSNIQKLSDGSYRFDIDNERIDSLAKSFGLTTEAVVSCIEALQMWGGVNLFDADEVALALNEVDYAAQDVGGKTVVNLERFEEELRNIGRNGKEIEDIKQSLTGFGNFSFVDFTTDAYSFAEALASIGEGYVSINDAGDGLIINLDNLAGLLHDIGATKEQVDALIGSFAEADYITFTNSEGEISDVDGALEALSGQFSETKQEASESTGSISGDMEAAANSVDNATNSMNNSLATTTNSVDVLTRRFYVLKGSIDALPSNKEITVTTNEVTNRIAQERANGTRNAISGTSLVGERGAELVVSDGVAYLVGQSGPEVVDLKAGDAVYTAEETRKIVGRGIINGVIPAFADGTPGRKKYASVTSDTSAAASDAYSGISDAADAISDTADAISDATDSVKEDTNEIIDWIEVAIDRIERAIDDVALIAESAYKKLSARSGALRDEISLVTKEIKIQAQGAKRYLQEAESVGLSEDLAELVRNGTIDINEYDEETGKLINTYKDWYEKSLDCTKATKELHETLASLYEDNFNNIQEDYENQLGLLEHLTKTYETNLELLEERGYFASTTMYDALSDVQSRNINTLEQELEQLTIAFIEAMESGEIEEYSSSWYSMQQEINGVKEAIDEAHVALAEYVKTQRELKWSYFDYEQERIQQITQESNFLIDLLSRSKLHNDNGSFTNQGMATAGLHAENYNIYMAQADKYAQEMLEVSKELANDPYNKDIIARREELLKLQQDSILAAEDEKAAIVDLVRDGIELELDSLKDLIDAYTTSLDNAKDLYDYQKNLSDQTKNIASLRKQLSAYENDTSEETRAKIQRISIDLQEAEEQLAETQYEQFVSDSKKLLDDLYIEYEELLNQRLDDTNALVSQVIDAVNLNKDSVVGSMETWQARADANAAEATNISNQNTESIKSTIMTETGAVGYTISDENRKIWQDGGSAQRVVEMYSPDKSAKVEGIHNSVTSIGKTIEGIHAKVEAMVKQSDEKTKQVITETETTTKPNASSSGSSNKSSNNNNSKSGDSGSGSGSLSNGSKIKLKAGAVWYNSSYGNNPTGSPKSIFGSATEREAEITLTNEKGTHPYHVKDTATGLILGWVKKEDIVGYKTGGTVDYTGLAMLHGSKQNPETVLNASDTKLFTALTETLRQIPLAALTSSLSAPGKFTESGSNNNFGDFNMNISIDHVEDYNDFVNQLKQDNQFERFIKSMTVDRMLGGNSLAKNKYNW